MTLHIEDPRSWFTPRRERWLWVSALLVTGAQAIMPSRSFDPIDSVLNTTAAVAR